MKRYFGDWGDGKNNFLGETLLCLFILLAFACNSAAGGTTVKVHKRSIIIGEKIRLGNISDIEGEEPDLRERLKSIIIGQSPLLGESRYIDRDYIEVRLKQHRIDVTRVKMEYPDSIEVFRDYRKVPKCDIQKILVDYITKNMPWDREHARVKSVKVPSDLVLPKGDLTYEVVPSKYWNFIGTASVAIVFTVNRRYQKKIWVSVETEVFGDVVVSSRPLRRYRIICKDDVRLERKNLAGLSQNAVTKLEDVIGKRARRAIDANVVMTGHLLDSPPVVKRGDFVTIIAETDVLKVTALGEVKQNGLRGEMTKVLNVASGKEVYGRVLDSKTVKVDF